MLTNLFCETDRYTQCNCMFKSVLWMLCHSAAVVLLAVPLLLWSWDEEFKKSVPHWRPLGVCLDFAAAGFSLLLLLLHLLFRLHHTEILIHLELLPSILLSILLIYFRILLFLILQSLCGKTSLNLPQHPFNSISFVCKGLIKKNYAFLIFQFTNSTL